MKFKKYTKEKLIEVIKESFSLRGVLINLGISPAGWNYQSLHKAIDLYQIDTSHFTGQGHLKGKTHKHRTRPLETVLVYGKYENTYQLKARLLKDGLKKRFCESCLLTMWLENSIPLELHHIDGNKK
jgi:23S rRNA C2498 (ribose-2'-O)-methylase RlmM